MTTRRITKYDKTKYIFRKWITLKDGRRLYAWQVGKKAFPIKIKK